MTTNLFTVHPSNRMIPAPRFSLGELVKWTDDDMSQDSFKGVIIEQNYRIDHEGGHWQFTAAITLAKRRGIAVSFYMNDFAFDLEESTLQTSSISDD